MKLFPVLIVTAALLNGLAHYLGFVFAPVEAEMGVVQKIFYFHVPSAFACYAGFLGCFVGSLMYLWSRKGRWDTLALAMAETGLAFGLIVLVTGPLWARAAWGVWWKWEPRLTAMALLFLMFLAYWVLQRFGGPGEGVRRFAAVVAVFGAPNIYFVHYAVQKWGGVHPEVEGKMGGGLHPDMRTAWLVSIVSVLLTFGLFARLRYVTLFQERQLRALRRRLSRAGG